MDKEINTGMEDASAPRGLKYDKGKPRYSLIPAILLKAVAKVLTFGAEKYAPNSWQTVPNAEERYLDALMRHLEAYRGGERVDEESGLTHLSHLATNVAFLLHFEEIEEHKARLLGTSNASLGGGIVLKGIHEQGANCPECDVPTICSEVASAYYVCKNSTCKLYNKLVTAEIKVGDTDDSRKR